MSSSFEISGQRLRAFGLAAVAAAAVVTSSPSARAEDVSPTGKGIAGGALVGGEVVVFAEALFGVRSSTAYLVGAGAGAVAGGVGGFFLERSVDDGRVPAYVLAGGLALFIPALVVALDQTRYLPPEGAREDKPVKNLPPAEPGKPGGSSVVGVPPSTPATPPPASETTPPASGSTPVPTPAPAPGTSGGGGAPRSLLDVHDGNFRMGLPLPEVRPVFSVAERKAFGLQNPGNELRFPVMRVTF